MKYMWNRSTRPPYLNSSETCMRVKKQQSEAGMEQPTDSKLGKDYNKAVYCHRTYLIYMQSTLCKMPGWIYHKLESRLLQKYQQPQKCRWNHSNGREWRWTRVSWWGWERQVKKLAWNSTLKKPKSWHPVPSLHSK